MNWNQITHPRLLDEVSGEGDTGGQPVADSTAVFSGPEQGGAQDGGSGGADPGQGDQSAGGQGQQVSQTGQGGQGFQFTPEMLSQVIRESVQLSQGQPQAAQQVPVQLTEEELFRHFKVPTVDEARFQAMLGLKPENPQQLQAFNMILREAALAGARMASYQSQATIQQMQERYAPLAQTIQQQKAEREEKAFFGRYKHLEAHKDTVLLVRAKMIQDGHRFDTAEQAEKALAASSEAYLKKFGVALSANGGKGQSAQPNGQRNMPTTNLGGQTSHGRPAGNGKLTPMQESLAIFQVGSR